MRTQTARLIELDDAAWHLPRVDPTGWLADVPASVEPGVAPVGPAVPSVPAAAPATPARPEATSGRVGGAAGSDAPAHVRARRPRRTAEARVARELELARRRRLRRGREGLWRRQGRVLTIDPVAGPVIGSSGGRPMAGAAGVADRGGCAAPDGWIADGAGRRRSVGRSGRRLAGPAVGEGDRIGRWERLALTVLVGATLVLVAIRLFAALTAGPEASTDVTVKPGDTLWSIATDAAPDRDPRAVIDEIRRLNQVTGDVVRAGEVLRVPASPDRGSAG